MRATWIIIAFAVGCSSKDAGKPAPKQEPEPPPAVKTPEPAPTQAGGSCDDRAARLGKRLQELAAATPGFMPIVAINAPQAAAGKPFDTRGDVVAMAKDGKTFAQGEGFATQKDLENYLDAMEKTELERFYMDGGNSNTKFPLYLWVDRDAPVSAIADLLASETVKDSHWAPRLLVVGTTAPEADTDLSPDVSAIAAKLPVGEPAATVYVADQLKAAMGSCSALITPLGTASLEGLPGKITEKLVKELPSGLKQCDCKITSPDAFEWGTDVWFGSTSPALAWIDMPKITKGDKQPLSGLVK